MLKKSDECAEALLMARVGAIAPGKANGYFARRSAIELVVLDGMVLAGALTMVAPRIRQPTAIALLLFAAPGLVLVVRSLVLALESREGRSVGGLRPDRAPAADAVTESAQRFARAGVIVLTAPLAPVAVVMTAASLLP